jgi:hypothetical protein
MNAKIRGVASGLTMFANMIAQGNISAQFGVVRFGGAPAIFLPLTDNLTDLTDTFNRLLTSSAGGQEAGLEAMRAALPPDNGNFMTKSCSTKYSRNCTFWWRPNALKVFILATDENSDLPTIARYRTTGQNSSMSFCGSGACLGGVEPPFLPYSVWSHPTTGATRNIYRTAQPMRMPGPYEEELRLTADALIRNNVYLNLLVSPKVYGGEAVAHFDSTSPYWNFVMANITNALRPRDSNTVTMYQYGHAGLSVQFANYSGFSSSLTLQNHVRANLTSSLNARILASGGFVRLFNVERFVNGVDVAMVNAFYTQVVRTALSILQFCSYPDSIIASTTLDDFAPIDGDNGEVAVVENSGSSGEVSTDEAISNFVSDITNQIVNSLINFTKSESNVAGLIGGATAAAVGAAAMMFAAYKRKELRMAIFGGKLLDKESELNNNPLYDTQGTKENPLYETGADKTDTASIATTSTGMSVVAGDSAV